VDLGSEELWLLRTMSASQLLRQRRLPSPRFTPHRDPVRLPYDAGPTNPAR
jgi:hypothetical protein